MKYVVFILLLIIFSCSKNDKQTEDLPELSEKWIEVETRTDTLSFALLGGKEVMFLNRGKEIRNGNMLPKSNSGHYQYWLEDEKISLYWMLSSNSNFNDYYFKIVGNRLNIGNFYSSTSDDILTFERLN